MQFLAFLSLWYSLTTRRQRTSQIVRLGKRFWIFSTIKIAYCLLDIFKQQLKQAEKLAIKYPKFYQLL
jgi:hypothetical protein